MKLLITFGAMWTRLEVVLVVPVPPLYSHLFLHLPGTPADGWGAGDRRAVGEHC